MKSVWDIDPVTSEEKLNINSFVHKFEGKWKTVTRYGISEAETRAYKGIIKTITTQPIREIDDLPVPSSWAEIVALRILFKNGFLLSRHAVVAQELFPKAELRQWRLNEQGPTGGTYWARNRFRLLSPSLFDRFYRNQPVRNTAELLKRPRSSEAKKDIGENENPLEKRHLAFCGLIEGKVNYGVGNDIGDAVKSAFKDTAEDTVKDVKDIVVDPSPSKQTTPHIPDDPRESGDSEDCNEFCGIFDDKLAPIRKAAKDGTEITTLMVDDLRKAHLEELKRHQPDGIFKQIENQHARELRDIRARYEGVITTWLRGVSSALQSTNQELLMLGDHKE
ncbi:hypothetical protein ACHAP8_007659 [Fusarium lateritium]